MGCRLILSVALGITICHVALATEEPENVPLRRFRRMHGGIVQSSESHPTVAVVEYFKKFVCSGSVANETIILTAAHCIEGKVPQFLTVKFGDLHPHSIDVASVSRHDEYNSVTYENDVGLIKLKQPVPNISNGHMVKLTKEYIVDFKDDLRLKSYPDVSYSTNVNDVVRLSVFTTKIIPKEECARMYGNLTVSSLKGQVCSVEVPDTPSDNSGRAKRDTNASVSVGKPNSSKAINKASGGPVMSADPNNNQVQVAIVSSSSACGLDVPDIYTVIPPVFDWIDETMNDMLKGDFNSNNIFGLSEDEIKFYKNLPAYPVKLTKSNFLVSIVDSATKNVKCVGAILSPDLIVTTARNCANVRPSEIQVKIDSFRTKNKDKYYPVHDLKIQPGYDESDHMTRHNLAVLHLANPLEFNEYINKTELTDRKIAPGQIVNIYGYDKTSKARSLSLIVGHNEECEYFHSRPVKGEEGRICAKRRLGMCLNPIGAPLLSGKNLVGLLSLQFSECADYRKPIVFTDLTWSDNQDFLQKMKHHDWKVDL